MYSCYSCKKKYPITEARWKCACGGFLTLPEDASKKGLFPRDGLAVRDRSIWRYKEAFGLPSAADTVSLGEGWTPLLKKETENGSVRFKLDYLMPSGSFKDRGAAVLITLCKAIGIRELVEDSSGNAGAAMAAYSAAAGLKCRIFAPSYTPEGKLIQTRLYGAEVVRVPGKRQNANDAVTAAAESSYYASHLWNPFFIQGHMSAAFEIWEQLGEKVPDTVVVPLGSGGYLEGLYRGFHLLKSAGYADSLPRIIGVQASGCRPLHEAFSRGLHDYYPMEPESTLAEGIAVSRPPRAAAVLEALHESGGATLAVEETEILDAHRGLLGLGLYTEPTSAAAFAGWRRLASGERKNAVIMLSGHGLKESEKLSGLYPS